MRRGNPILLFLAFVGAFGLGATTWAQGQGQAAGQPGGAQPQGQGGQGQTATQTGAQEGQGQAAGQPGGAQPQGQGGQGQTAAQPQGQMEPSQGTGEATGQGMPSQAAPAQQPQAVPRQAPRQVEPAQPVHVPAPMPKAMKEVTPASHMGKPKPTLPEVRSTFGSLRILGLLQGQMLLPLRSTFSSSWVTFKKNDLTKRQHFTVEAERIRLILLGHLLNKNLKYVFQGDANLEGRFLLDFKFIYNLPWVPGLSIMVGRYLPHFSLIMPVLITRLEAAEYPIFLTEGHYAPWRQMGGEIIYKHQFGPGKLMAIAGVFTGPVNGWTDDNDYKDVLLRAEYGFNKGPAKGLWFGINSWIGFPHCKYDSDNPDSKDNTCAAEDAAKDKADTEIKTGFMYRYTRKFGIVGVNLLGEVYWRRFVPRAENRDIVDGYTVWTHLGIPITKWVEPLVRFDYLSMNVDDDKDFAWRVTAGLNVFLEGIHSHFKINYIYEKTGDDYTGTPSWTDAKFQSDPKLPPVTKRDFHMFIVQINTEF